MRKILLGAFAATLFVPQAFAAGFAIKNEAPSYLAQSYAGVSAAGDDVAAQFYNGALISDYQRLTTSGGVSVLIPKIEAKNFAAESSAGTPVTGRSSRGNAVPISPIPNFSAAFPLAQNWTAGVALTTPWGLATSYDDDWKGRYYGITTRLTSINITPTVAYRVNEQLALSLGGQAQYAKGRLTKAVDCGLVNAIAGFGLPYTPGSSANDCHADLQGTDWGYGYTGGLLFKPDSVTRVGLSYRSEIQHKLKGDVKYQLPNPVFAAAGLNNSDASLRLNTPAMATLGMQRQVSRDFTFGAEAQWTQWGSTEEFRGQFASGQADDVTQADWKDAWFFSLGGQLRPDQDRLAYRFGVGFDETPTNNRTREVRVPDSNRYWLSMGAGYDLTANTTLNATYLKMYFDDTKINQTASGANAARGTLRGDYRSSLDILSLSLASQF